MYHLVTPTTAPYHLPIQRRSFNSNIPVYLLVGMASTAALIFIAKLAISELLSVRRRRRQQQQQQQQQRELRGPEPMDIVLPVFRRAGPRGQNRESDTGAERDGVVDDGEEREGGEEGSGGGDPGRLGVLNSGDEAEGIHSDQADGRATIPACPLQTYQRRAEDRVQDVDMV